MTNDIQRYDRVVKILVFQFPVAQNWGKQTQDTEIHVRFCTFHLSQFCYVVLCTGLSLTIQTTVMSDIVGVQHVARAQAFVLMFTGVAALLAVPIAGKYTSSSARFIIVYLF